jgi:electron transport complex protein RnfG
MSKQPSNNLTPEQSKTKISLSSAISNNSIILAIFAFVSVGLIAITHHLTKGRIAKEIELSLINQLSQIVDPNTFNNDVYNDCILMTDANRLGSSEPQKVYRLRNNETDVGVMITATAPDGYSGRIDFALAVSADDSIYGLNILRHQETPGLGDKIERQKSNWLEQFNDIAKNHYDDSDWNVKKDGGKFDALTGATITPRAIVSAVKKSYEFVLDNQTELYSLDSNCYPESKKNDG